MMANLAFNELIIFEFKPLEQIKPEQCEYSVTETNTFRKYMKV